MGAGGDSGEGEGIMRTFYSYLRGGNGVGVGAESAGLTDVGGVESDPAIAGVCDLNFDSKTTVADVCDVDPAALLSESPYAFHASPQCTYASSANQSAERGENGSKETESDRDQARAVCRFISYWKPKIVTLENVWQYRTFPTCWPMILGTLTGLGYSVDFWHLNCADYGVPQSRMRLILIAKLGEHRIQRPTPTHHDPADVEPSQLSFFAPATRPHVGWLEAIADLVDGLPVAHHAKKNQPCEHDPLCRPCRKTEGLCRGHFATWQEARLPDSIKGDALFDVSNSKRRSYVEDNAPLVMRSVDTPAMTITSGIIPRAYLIDSAGYPDAVGMQVLACRDEDQPANTIVANHERRPMRAYILDCQKGGIENGEAFATLPQGGEPVFTITAGKGERQPLRAYLVYEQNSSRPPTVLSNDQPAATMIVHSPKHPAPKACLVESRNSGQQWGDHARAADEPAMVITATDRPSHYQKAWIGRGRVVTMTPRCNFRFQSFPDSYILSGDNRLDSRVGGNAVPPKLAEVVYRQLMNE